LIAGDYYGRMTTMVDNHERLAWPRARTHTRMTSVALATDGWSCQWPPQRGAAPLLPLLSLLSSKMDGHSRSVSNPSLSRYPFDYDNFFGVTPTNSFIMLPTK